MQDCKLTIEIKNDKAEIEAKGCGMVEVAFICGILEQTMGLRALRLGKSLDDVKDNMLDIHLAAMENLTKQVINGRSEET
jgi:hypothetical protein